MAETFVQTVSAHTMTLDIQKGFRSSRMAHLCVDLFQIVLRMHDSRELGAPSALRKLILYYLTLFERNCRLMRISTGHIDDARYALVALIDETVLSVPGQSRDYWLVQPLQLELFGEALAGEEFYTRAQRLLGQGESARQVLEVYYLCAVLGFEGKYRLTAGAEREKLLAVMNKALIDAWRIRSPLGTPGTEPPSCRQTRRRNQRFFRHWLPATIALVAVVGVWLRCVWATSQKLDKVVHNLGEILGR